MAFGPLGRKSKDIKHGDDVVIDRSVPRCSWYYPISATTKSYRYPVYHYRWIASHTRCDRSVQFPSMIGVWRLNRVGQYVSRGKLSRNTCASSVVTSRKDLSEDMLEC